MNKNYILYRREEIQKEIFAQGSLSKAAKSLGMPLIDLLGALRLYRQKDGTEGIPPSKPAKKFKDPFPSRNIEHPDKPGILKQWDYRHNWMKIDPEPTVGKVRFPYNPNYYNDY